ncbi:TetR/AcrR family transcriptional regulator [Caldisphaera sp.]|uniref:TetR/AcrR family transcriptional regulator n=1 Tax=Caldisphaera sp. TaxID=2060322 RepID=UPI00269802BC
MSDISKVKSRIINAAMKVFSEKGYDAASTEIIAKESGISKGDLFYHFKTKNELIRYIAYISLPTDVIENVLNKKYSNGEEMLIDFGISFLKKYEDKNMRTLFLMNFGIIEKYPDIKEALYKSCEEYIDRLFSKVENLSKVKIPLHVRRAFMGALFCYVAWWDTNIDQNDYIKQIIKDIVKL